MQKLTHYVTRLGVWKHSDWLVGSCVSCTWNRPEGLGHSFYFLFNTVPEQAQTIPSQHSPFNLFLLSPFNYFLFLQQPTNSLSSYSNLPWEFSTSVRSLRFNSDQVNKLPLNNVKPSAKHLTASSGSRLEPEAIAWRANPQTASALVQLPTEIKEMIFREIWKDAGVFQHLILRRGRVIGMKCVTDITAPDELQESCQTTGCTELRDPVLWRRLRSTWGCHWKCEELQQSRSKGRGHEWSPFLPMLLICRQL